MEKIVTILLQCFVVSAIAQQPLFIPDTLSGPAYNLTMHKDSMQFFPGNISHTYAFNANKYLGPTLIFNKGTNVSITVNNQIADTTAIHWHGIHIPSKWDGGPHTPILPGATWNPQFTVMDNAATYWYHPHPDMKTAQQAIRGAAGLIIVRDAVESAIVLPRKYGVDDFPIIAQCQQYDSLNQAMPKGMQDSTLLVNGTIDPYLNAPAQVVRMRLLNASGERVFNFGFTGNMAFYMIASDGGLLDTTAIVTRIRLAPGERAEILLNLSGMNGQTIYLMSYASELPMGIQGGPTMPMPPPSPPMDSPLNGIDFNILKINVVPQTANPVTTIPGTLTTVTPYLESQANITRTIRFTADSIDVMDGPFYFNDSTFDMMRIDYEIPLNSIEIWRLVNRTMVAHPFHIHDVQFNILDRHGIPPGPEESGWKDVILIPPYDSARFITKFTDFVDTVIPYMFHCHILMHEDDGMMGQFVVSPFGLGVNNINMPGNMKVYPNPVVRNGAVNIRLERMKNEKVTYLVSDLLGRELSRDEATAENGDLKINVQNLATGAYLLKIISENSCFVEKIVIE